MTTADHTAADAAREAIDQLEDERDTALAEVDRVNRMRECEVKAHDWLCEQRDEAERQLDLESHRSDDARAETARVRRFVDAAWPRIEDDQ